MKEITIFILPRFDTFRYRCLLNSCGSRMEDYIKCVRVDANIESLQEYGKEMYPWYRKYARIERCAIRR